MGDGGKLCREPEKTVTSFCLSLDVPCRELILESGELAQLLLGARRHSRHRADGLRPRRVRAGAAADIVVVVVVVVVVGAAATQQ